MPPSAQRAGHFIIHGPKELFKPDPASRETTAPDGGALDSARAEFARAYVASTLGAKTAAQAEHKLLKEVFSALSREEETRSGHRDTWGNWDWSFSRAHLDGTLNRPFVDEALRRTLGAGDDPVRWPNSAPFAVCLSHDLDDIGRRIGVRRAARSLRDQFGASGPLLARSRRAYGIIGRTLLAPLIAESQPELHRWLDVEAEFGFRSTIFVVAPRLARPHTWDVHYSPNDLVSYRGRRSPLLTFLSEAANGGWDIGVHGSIASALTPDLLMDERRQIEAMVDRPVTSCRQHYLRFDIPLTPRLQASAGIAVDSTLGFNRAVGFRSGAAFPHFLWDWDEAKSIPLLEVPQHIMDGGLFTANALEYDRDLAIRHVVRLMDAVEAVGGCLTLSWHPNANPAWWDVYPTLLSEAKRRGAWGCSVGQLADFWQTRLRTHNKSAQ